ncbi:MAG: hypothetical protein JO333_16665 [Verrucomicrobia bacterium]|nr:hypothetical protein [Verrucomicrobiota bacterium]
MAHLSPALQQRLLARALSPEEMLAAIKHLRGCQLCRDSLTGLRSQTGSSLADQVLPDYPQDEHPPADLLAAYIDNGLDASASDPLENHMSGCALCRENLADLRKFRNELQQIPMRNYEPVGQVAKVKAASIPTSAGWRISLIRWVRQPIILGSLAAAVAVLFVISCVSLRSLFLFGAVTSQKGHPGQVTLIDGSRQVHLSENGILTPAVALPKDELHALDSLATPVLQNKSLSLPQWTADNLAALKRAPSVLLGQESGPIPLHIIHPLRTLVQSVHPTFEWSTVTGATSYTVHVVADDRSQEEVATSQAVPAPAPELMTCSWTLTEPMSLTSGKRYRWYVTATISNQDIDAPGMKEPQAKFAVLSEADFVRLNSLKKANPGDPLLDGLLNLKMGLLDDAQTDFQGLLDDPKQTESGKEFLTRIIAEIRRLEEK